MLRERGSWCRNGLSVAHATRFGLSSASVLRSLSVAYLKLCSISVFINILTICLARELTNHTIFLCRKQFLSELSAAMLRLMVLRASAAIFAVCALLLASA